jgi:hypothetical protein
MGDWIASSDEERWDGSTTYETREEAVKLAPEELDLESGQTFWTGKKVAQATDALVSKGRAESFAEQLAEDVCEDMDSDFCEDWLKLTPDEEKKLAALLSRAVEDFIEQNPKHKPTWFRPENVKEHEAPEMAKEAEA